MTHAGKAGVRQRGAALVELALTLSVMLAVLLAASELGRAIYQYNNLVKSVGAAARYLSRYNAGDSTAIGAAKTLAVYGKFSPTQADPVLVPGLATSLVSVCDSTSCPADHSNVDTGAGQINLVTVSITGARFATLAPDVLPAFTFPVIRATTIQLQ